MWPNSPNFLWISLLTRHAVIFDLELTAWDGSLARNWTGEGEFREVIQIGAVALDIETLEEAAHMEVLVRPVRNPVLSPYICDLTRISNERMAREGIGFVEACAMFREFAGGAALWSYGRDADILNENIALHGVEATVPVFEGADISLWFEAQGFDLTGINSGKLAAFVGAKAQGPEHEGLADARSITAALRKLVRDGAPNPFK